LESGLEQLIELAGALQGEKIVAATYMGRADPYLRN
jgi:hypothetical protein